MVGEEYVRWSKGSRGAGSLNSMAGKSEVIGGGSGAGSRICKEAFCRGATNGITGVDGRAESRDKVLLESSDVENVGVRQSGEGVLVEDGRMGTRNTDGGVGASTGMERGDKFACETKFQSSSKVQSSQLVCVLFLVFHIKVAELRQST